MRRALTLILGVALFGILAAVVVASQGADDPAGTTGTVTETVERTTTVEDNPNPVRDDDNAQGEDISGPCDEAEHANDPRCTGTPANPPADDNPGQDDDAARVDNSGPGSLNSGPGSVHSGRDDRADDDRRGEVEVGDDHGGRGEVEVGDDHGGNSGPGGGDDSGHGGGDD